MSRKKSFKFFYIPILLAFTLILSGLIIFNSKTDGTPVTQQVDNFLNNVSNYREEIVSRSTLHEGGEGVMKLNISRFSANQFLGEIEGESPQVNMKYKLAYDTVMANTRINLKDDEWLTLLDFGFNRMEEFKGYIKPFELLDSKTWLKAIRDNNLLPSNQFFFDNYEIDLAKLPKATQDELLKKRFYIDHEDGIYTYEKLIAKLQFQYGKLEGLEIQLKQVAYRNRDNSSFTYPSDEIINYKFYGFNEQSKEEFEKIISEEIN